MTEEQYLFNGTIKNNIGNSEYIASIDDSTGLLFH